MLAKLVDSHLVPCHRHKIVHALTKIVTEKYSANKVAQSSINYGSTLDQAAPLWSVKKACSLLPKAWFPYIHFYKNQ